MAARTLVEELQSRAPYKEGSIADLLRKTKLVASKLGLQDAVSWVDAELNGYPEDAKVPEYRKVRGQLKANNGYCWIPAIVDNESMYDVFTSRWLPYSIAELESLSESKDLLSISWPDHLARKCFPGATQVSIFFSPTALKGVIDRVRTMVLDWALSLEAAGIMGEDVSFTPEEKQKAASTPSINTYHFHAPAAIGNIGSQLDRVAVNVSQQVNSGLPIEKVAEFVKQVNQVRDMLQLEYTAGEQLSAALNEVTNELEKPLPDDSRIRACLKLVQGIVEKTAVSIASSGILKIIGNLLDG